MTMRIGIDAKWYFDGPPSGKRVVRNLVDYLLKLDEENEYYIFLNKEHRKEPFPAGSKENVKVIYVWAGNNLISNLFLLPLFSRKLKLNALLYQNFISPLDQSKRIAYIHDVLFLSNPEYYTIFERIYFAPLKLLTRKSDGIITVSEEEKKRLLKFGFSEKENKVIVAHHGVEPGFVPLAEHENSAIQAVKAKYLLPNDFILFVGRLNLRKNVDNLLRAIPLLKSETIPLVIVGADDWKKSNHERTLKQLGIANRVIFTGAIYKDLNIVYSLAKVFCFPSYAESFGLPPLEAMASGVPIVVSNTTSLPEVCGVAGVYVAPDKPKEIANAIDSLLTNSRLYCEKRALGLEQAKKFKWENSARVVKGFLEALVKNTKIEKGN